MILPLAPTELQLPMPYSTCEADYSTLQSYFGGITPAGLPIQVVVAPLDASGNGGGGAYHATCASVTLYCDVKWLPALNTDYTRLLVIAEEVEVFQAAQGTGWNCGANNGEGLSRVLAEVMYPNGIISWMYSAPTWLDSPTRPDYITITDHTDRNYVSTGCSVLFLYYLHVQLGFSWAQIVQSSGSTLEATYQTLTGKTGAYSTFTSFLQTFYPIGTPSGLTTDDPFPLGKHIKEIKEKDHKEIKDIKEKEHKEKDKDIKEIKEKDKDIEGPPPGPPSPPGVLVDADLIRRLTDRIDSLEKQVASGKAFIRPDERPPVGKKVLKKGEEKNKA
jgi:hypothetical protein